MRSHTTIYPDVVRELPFVLAETGASKIFLVTGKVSYEASGAQKKIQELLKDWSVNRFSDFQPNPEIEDIKKGATLFKESGCDCILAIGGGSVIDMAKLINYFHQVDLHGLNESTLHHSQFKPSPLICLPTTAGSGSEATHFAVMYIGVKKFSIAHQQLMPQTVLVDPQLQMSQTPYQKAVSGVDAFSQALESMWNVHSTPESLQLAENALRLTWNNLEKAVVNNDVSAQWALASAANLAGRAINITKTTAPHALSYGFTKLAGLPHGHAVALSIPFFIDYHQKIEAERCNDPRGVVHVRRIMERAAKILDCPSQELSEKVKAYFEVWGLSVGFKALGISKDQFDAAVGKVNYERLKNNPAKVDEHTLAEWFVYNNY